MHVKILGEINPAYRIGQNAECRSGNHHGHNGQTIQTIGEVDSIGGANDYYHSKGKKQYAKRHQCVFQDRHSHLQA